MSNGRPYRKVQCIDRINGTRFYVYDANNNIKTITLQNNANGGDQTTTYHYDAYDRKTEDELPSPDGQVRKTTWAYYQNGTVDTVTDPKGQVTKNIYDLDNRLVEAQFKTSVGALDETRTFDYNDLNKPLTVTDRNGTTTFAYHANDLWLHTETRQTPGQTNYTVTSHYDANGNRTQCEYPGTSRTLALGVEMIRKCTLCANLPRADLFCPPSYCGVYQLLLPMMLRKQAF